MSRSRSSLTLLGIGAAAAFAAVALPMAAIAHADDSGADNGIAPGYGGGPYETCDGGVCLVMGDENLSDWTYSGIRPFFTMWEGDQEYQVQYDPATASNPPDGLASSDPSTSGDASTTVDAGSYDIKVEDFWNPIYYSSDYQFGDFTPDADAPANASSLIGWYGDMSGATIDKTSAFDGEVTNLTMYNIGPDDANYEVFSTPDFTNTVVTADGASADYIQIGNDAPVFLWNSLFHSGLAEAQVPSFLIPDDPFSGIDFDPSEYVDGAAQSVAGAAQSVDPSQFLDGAAHFLDGILASL